MLRQGAGKSEISTLFFSTSGAVAVDKALARPRQCEHCTGGRALYSRLTLAQGCLWEVEAVEDVFVPVSMFSSLL